MKYTLRMYTPPFHRFILLSLVFLTNNEARAAREEFGFDFRDFLVATAEYEEGPTGMTLFSFPSGALTAVDVRGGAAATRETTLLDSKSAYPAVDAIVLAGGSTYGLEAASGVMSSLLEQRGGRTGFADIPSVPAAIVYDFSGRQNSVYPDAALGKRAFRALRRNQVSIGEAGAGRNVTVGKYFGRAFAEKSGQGAFFVEIGGLKIFGLTVVNAMGTINGLDGRVVRGNFDRRTSSRHSIPEQLLAGTVPLTTPTVPGNTTISIVITNAKLDHAALERISVMAHTAMGRVIEPFHSPSDGDTLFAVTTGTFALPAGSDAAEHIGTVAGRVMQNAVLSAARSTSIGVPRR